MQLNHADTYTGTTQTNSETLYFGYPDLACGDASLDGAACVLRAGHDGMHYDGIAHWPQGDNMGAVNA